MRRPPALSLRLPHRPRWVFLFVALFLAVAALHEWRPELFRHAPSPALESENRRVARVVDGDTILLADPSERVRLIGADAPETVKPNWPVETWGPEAAAFTRHFLSGGEARLEFDGPTHDKYGRKLAYVWVGDRMLNEELIRAGLARARLQYEYSASVKDRFRRAEAEARSAHRGIWSAKEGTTDEHE